MKNGTSYDIVLLGHFSVDRNIVAGHEAVQSGGAVFYGSIPAARLGLRVAVITKAAEKDFHMLKPMEDAGVSVFPIASDSTTSIENRYLDDTQERRISTPLAFAGEYAIDELPRMEWKILHIAGLIRGEVGIETLEELSKRGKLSADVQGFVRVIRGDKMVYEDWPEKREALPLLDFLKADAAEAEILTGETDVFKAAGILSGWGAGEIVLTHPGGVLVHTSDGHANFPFTPKEVLGRTGRGDTTICSYLSRRLSHGPIDSAAFAAALVSLKMEKQGPFSGSIEDVLKRMEKS